MRIYGLDVKGRMRTLNHHNFLSTHGPRRYGPRVRRGRPTHVPLSTLKKKEKKPYFTNCKVFKFNSTFTFLPNTNE